MRTELGNILIAGIGQVKESSFDGLLGEASSQKTSSELLSFVFFCLPHGEEPSGVLDFVLKGIHASKLTQNRSRNAPPFEFVVKSEVTLWGYSSLLFDVHARVRLVIEVPTISENSKSLFNEFSWKTFLLELFPEVPGCIHSL